MVHTASQRLAKRCRWQRRPPSAWRQRPRRAMQPPAAPAAHPLPPPPPPPTAPFPRVQQALPLSARQKQPIHGSVHRAAAACTLLLQCALQQLLGWRSSGMPSASRSRSPSGHLAAPEVLAHARWDRVRTMQPVIKQLQPPAPPAADNNRKHSQQDPTRPKLAAHPQGAPCQVLKGRRYGTWLSSVMRDKAHLHPSCTSRGHALAWAGLPSCCATAAVPAAAERIQPLQILRPCWPGAGVIAVWIAARVITIVNKLGRIRSGTEERVGINQQGRGGGRGGGWGEFPAGPAVGG